MIYLCLALSILAIVIAVSRSINASCDRNWLDFRIKYCIKCPLESCDLEKCPVELVTYAPSSISFGQTDSMISILRVLEKYEKLKVNPWYEWEDQILAEHALYLQREKDKQI